MKILVTYAVQGEFTELKFPGLIGEEEVHIGYIRTGVGKVKSAYYVSEVLNQAKPDLVINVGTAGSIDCQVADMGLEYEIDSSALLAEKGYCMHWAGEGICNTGDTFLTELSDVKGDVVDMEAFAQAFVCRAKNVPFIAVKYVTDIIGQNSVKHWEDKLADARKGLGEFFEQIGGAVK